MSPGPRSTIDGRPTLKTFIGVCCFSTYPALHLVSDKLYEVPLFRVKSMGACNPDVSFCLDLVGFDIVLLVLGQFAHAGLTGGRIPVLQQDVHFDFLALILGTLEYIEAPYVSIGQALYQGAAYRRRGRNGHDGWIVGVLDPMTAVSMQNGRPHVEERCMCGRWRGLRAPDDALQHGWGHEGAVEEGRVRHGGRGEAGGGGGGRGWSGGREPLLVGE